MTDFEFSQFFCFVFKYSNSFSLCKIDPGQNIYVWDYVFQFGWVVINKVKFCMAIVFFRLNRFRPEFCRLCCRSVNDFHFFNTVYDFHLTQL